MRRALAALAVVALAACGGGSDEPERQAAATQPQGGLTDVTDVAAFGREFDADRGKPRLLVLMSPT
jgi:hypothetical protein